MWKLSSYYAKCETETITHCDAHGEIMNGVCCHQEYWKQSRDVYFMHKYVSEK